ncbi:cytochrome b562 [Haemophilus sputorum]|uniref:cytochrome b562 n=1 Tax=Haemophilus sputorum TaxID=1078480 RepID=UPI0028D07C11|nr:cytochrome b562 [Haemophilus sputorum]
MKKQLNALTQAENPDAFHQAAEIFVTQAQEAQNKTPISLSAEEDANRLKGYQAGIQGLHRKVNIHLWKMFAH